jgi:hypothetical protein
MIWTLVANWLEIAGGARPLPEAWRGTTLPAVVRAGWWLLLFVLAVAFAGRNTKFVYVDF